jgi:hypothetical protein
MIYDEAVITLFTDLNPNGNYSAFVPRDIKLPETRASEVEARLQELQKITLDIDTKLSDLSSILNREIDAAKFTFVKHDKPCPEGFAFLGRIGWIMDKSNYKNDIGPGGDLALSPTWQWTHPILCGR